MRERKRASEQLFCAGDHVQAASLLEGFAIARWSDAAHAAKLAIEIGQIEEANFKSDHAYRQICLREAHTCAANAELAQVLACATACVLHK